VEIAAVHAASRMNRLRIEVPGIGKLIATVASIPDPGVFKSGRGFSAWLGLTPRQNAGGGKPALAAITSYETADFIYNPLHYLALLEQKAKALDQAAPLDDWRLADCIHRLRRLDAKIANQCVALVEQPEQIQSRTNFHWWPKPIIPN
jgi:Transposase IS116/IS110/IS902 family